MNFQANLQHTCFVKNRKNHTLEMSTGEKSSLQIPEAWNKIRN